MPPLTADHLISREKGCMKPKHSGVLGLQLSHQWSCWSTERRIVDSHRPRAPELLGFIHPFSLPIRWLMERKTAGSCSPTAMKQHAPLFPADHTSANPANGGRHYSTYLSNQTKHCPWHVPMSPVTFLQEAKPVVTLPLMWCCRKDIQILWYAGHKIGKLEKHCIILQSFNSRSKPKIWSAYKIPAILPGENRIPLWCSFAPWYENIREQNIFCNYVFQLSKTV